MERTGEITGGLDIKDVANGGAVFEIQYDSQSADDAKEEKECALALENYLKLECLNSDVPYDGGEPFSNIAKEMHNLLQNGKVKKKIVREGYGSKPEAHSNVNVHYNAYVQYEAQPFDSTYARKKPFTFTLGDGQVIEGLETAVLSMKLNEKAQFLIDSELAYRSGGLGRIPPNSTVLFEIELNDIQGSPQQTSSKVDEKEFPVAYRTCQALCVQGKNLVKLKDYQSAVKVYLSAVNKLEEAILNDYEDQVKSEELLVQLCTNLLICYTCMENPKRGCIFAQRIYEMAKNETFTISAKVYFNHAKCLRMLGEYSRAQRKLAQARGLQPNSKNIQQEFFLLQEAKEKHREQEKKFGKALVRS